MRMHWVAVPKTLRARRVNSCGIKSGKTKGKQFIEAMNEHAQTTLGIKPSRGSVFSPSFRPGEQNGHPAQLTQKRPAQLTQMARPDRCG
jgi:hypothetical protein|eukprot:COSAG01_NODE_752_length_13837_cov_76.381670_17_plen_89_part_00